jgi:hypothetical protein
MSSPPPFRVQAFNDVFALAEWGFRFACIIECDAPATAAVIQKLALDLLDGVIDLTGSPDRG